MRFVNDEHRIAPFENVKCRYIRRMVNSAGGRPRSLCLTDDMCMELFERFMLPNVCIKRLEESNHRGKSATKPSKLVRKFLRTHNKGRHIFRNKPTVAEEARFVVQTVEDNGMKLHLSRSSKLDDKYKKKSPDSPSQTPMDIPVTYKVHLNMSNPLRPESKPLTKTHALPRQPISDTKPSDDHQAASPTISDISPNTTVLVPSQSDTHCSSGANSTRSTPRVDLSEQMNTNQKGDLSMLNHLRAIPKPITPSHATPRRLISDTEPSDEPQVSSPTPSDISINSTVHVSSHFPGENSTRSTPRVDLSEQINTNQNGHLSISNHLRAESKPITSSHATPRQSTSDTKLSADHQVALPTTSDISINSTVQVPSHSSGENSTRSTPRVNLANHKRTTNDHPGSSPTTAARSTASTVLVSNHFYNNNHIESAENNRMPVPGENASKQMSMSSREHSSMSDHLCPESKRKAPSHHVIPRQSTSDTKPSTDHQAASLTTTDRSTYSTFQVPSHSDSNTQSSDEKKMESMPRADLDKLIDTNHKLTTNDHQASSPGTADRSTDSIVLVSSNFYNDHLESAENNRMSMPSVDASKQLNVSAEGHFWTNMSNPLCPESKPMASSYATPRQSTPDTKPNDDRHTVSPITTDRCKNFAHLVPSHSNNTYDSESAETSRMPRAGACKQDCTFIPDPYRSSSQNVVQACSSTEHDNLENISMEVLDLSCKSASTATLNSQPGKVTCLNMVSNMELDEETSGSKSKSSEILSQTTTNVSGTFASEFHGNSLNLPTPPYSPPDIVRQHRANDTGMNTESQISTNPGITCTKPIQPLVNEICSRQTGVSQNLEVFSSLETGLSSHDSLSAESLRRQRHYHNWGQPSKIVVNGVTEDLIEERQPTLQKSQVCGMVVDASADEIVMGLGEIIESETNQHEMLFACTDSNSAATQKSKTGPQVFRPLSNHINSLMPGHENVENPRYTASQATNQQYPLRGPEDQPADGSKTEMRISQHLPMEFMQEKVSLLRPNRGPLTARESSMNLPHFHTILPQNCESNQFTSEVANTSTTQEEAFRELQRLKSNTRLNATMEHTHNSFDHMEDQGSIGSVNQSELAPMDVSSSRYVPFPFLRQAIQYQRSNTLQYDARRNNPHPSSLTTQPHGDGMVPTRKQEPTDPFGQTEMCCLACGGRPMFVCNGCRRAVYCSPRCQLKTWAEHIKMCQSHEFPF